MYSNANKEKDMTIKKSKKYSKISVQKIPKKRISFDKKYIYGHYEPVTEYDEEDFLIEEDNEY